MGKITSALTGKGKLPPVMAKRKCTNGRCQFNGHVIELRTQQEVRTYTNCYGCGKPLARA